MSKRPYVYTIFSFGPRGKVPVYVGKGHGDRCYAHLSRDDFDQYEALTIDVCYYESEEIQLAQEARLIKSYGLDALHNKVMPRARVCPVGEAIERLAEGERYDFWQRYRGRGPGIPGDFIRLLTDRLSQYLRDVRSFRSFSLQYPELLSSIRGFDDVEVELFDSELRRRRHDLSQALKIFSLIQRTTPEERLMYVRTGYFRRLEICVRVWEKDLAHQLLERMFVGGTQYRNYKKAA